MAPDARAVLADLASLGPFFEVSTDPAEGVDPTWRPVRALHEQEEPLRDRIAHVRRVLGSDDRVAASIAFQGLAAVLVSAPLAAVMRHGVLPDLDADRLHWRPTASGPWRLWCDTPTGRPVDGVDELAALVLDEHLAPLVAAVRARVSISARLLWGNAASAVAGAKRMVGTRWPDAAERAAGVAAALLDTGPLAGSGERRDPEPPDHGWTFRRRSCCLYYRIEGGGYCGDCVLAGMR